MRKSTRYSALRVAALCATLLSAPLATAVSLSPRGTGQVLIYPYYTVNGGQSTLLSLVNTTAHAKALRLHFREGYNGREVLGFNLYLAPYDVWTGALFALTDDGGANLLTDDRSCTVPALRSNTTLPVLADGRRYVPFGNAAYVGAHDDTGPTSLTRTREGSLEVIEMGEVVDGSPSGKATTHVNGVPTDCASLARAWDSGGYWSTSPGTDVSKPSGGMYGTLAVVNPAQGTIFQVAAAALDGFSAYAQHSAPGNAHPDLGDARSSGIDVQPPYADADVEVDGKIRHLHYLGADRAVDAVSALLMATVAYAEWVYEAQNVANTDLLFTFPTKRHYVDPSVVLAQASGHREVLPPFADIRAENMFGQKRSGESCVEHGPAIFDREEGQPSGPTIGFPEPPDDPNRRFPSTCTQTAVLIPTPATPSVLHSSLLGYLAPLMPAKGGTWRLDLDPGTEPHLLRPATDGTRLRGLPVIGFQVVNYQGGNVVPNVLANYSAAVPIRSSVGSTTECAPEAGGCP
jgi:hypothetical protein